MNKLILSLILSILLTACQSQPTLDDPPPSSQDSAKQYAAIRDYEQKNGLFDWSHAPGVTG